MNAVAENTILVSEKAKAKITQLMQEADIANDPAYFLRVGVLVLATN
jgi:iron-sulfur cluster assembly protein